MQRIFYTLIFVATFSIASNAQAEDIKVDSTIKSATIYADRATLTRRGTLEVPAGSHILMFEGMPINTYTNSLKAGGKAKGKVTFGALTHKRANAQDCIRPKERELNDTLLLLQDSRRVLGAEKKALKAGRTFLENIGKQAYLRENEDIAKLDLNPNDWANAADSLTLEIAENLKMALAMDVKIREVDGKIQKTQNDLNDLRTGQKQSYTVSIPVEVAAATTLTVDLDYQLPNVGWQPIYDARLETKTGSLELVQYGSVWQRTGEDWDDIEITLSTAQPSRGASLPELHPHWVSIFEAKQRGRTMMRKEMPQMMAMDMAAGAPMESFAANAAPKREMLEEKVHLQSAQINTEGFVGEYKIVGLSDVKSNGERSKHLIGTFETENKLQVQIKPQIDTSAYLVAQTTLKGEAPILPGQVNLFRDGAFIGQSYIPMLRQGDQQDLGFGVDDNVTVTRSMLKDKRSEAGMISKDKVLERTYVTEIKNLHKDPIEIAVFENAPVSKDERVRVEIVQNETTQGYKTDIDNKKGVMRWVTTLKSQEESEISLGWKVNWPKDTKISGL